MKKILLLVIVAMVFSTSPCAGADMTDYERQSLEIQRESVQLQREQLMQDELRESMRRAEEEDRYEREKNDREESLRDQRWKEFLDGDRDDCWPDER